MVTVNSITVGGLYGFKKETIIKFGNNNLIVGPNNGGKTNIFRLFKFLISALTFVRLTNVRYNKTERFPTLKFDIHLSENEIEDLSTFVMISLLSGTPFSSETLNEFLIHFRKLRDFILELKFADTGTEDIIVSEWLLTEKHSGLQIRKTANSQFITNGKATNQVVAFTVALEHLKKNGVTHLMVRPDHLLQFVNDVGNPIILNDATMAQHPKDIIDFTNIKEKFEYSSSQNVSFFSLLGNIMQSKISYLSEQRRIKEQEEMLDTKKLDEDGTNLASYLFSLKLNSSKEFRIHYSEIETQFSKILNNEVNFNIIFEEKPVTTPDNKPSKHIIPKIVFEKNGIQFSQDEMGAGIKEILLLLTKSKLEKESIILMDEPALHIHPIQLKTALREIIQNITGSKSQLLLISHSVNMPIVEFLEENNQLIYVKMKDGITSISEPNKEDKKTLLEIFPKLELDLDVEIFFSRCVILVEGDSEIGILQGLNNRLGKNIGLKDIHLVSLYSNSNLGTYLIMLKIFSIPYVALLDLDSFTRIKEGNLSTLLKSIKEVYPEFMIEIQSLDFSDVVHSKEPKWAKSFRDASKKELSEIKTLVEETIQKNSGSIKEYKETTCNLLLEKFETWNVFGIKEGTIEDLMKSIDVDLYDKVMERSKRMSARNFINKLEDSKLSRLIIPQRVLERAIELASH